ncbi:MAG TPA: GNAT family N-acetyltransferase [Anaerolineales bacterium]|nr:GNAT family N-acetyltransferase [Anaerolineales bacterium]
MPDLLVRPYQPADRPAFFRIGADTAFFGAPIEAYMEDRNIFLDAFYAYYTDLEPEHAWVACADGQVVGFLAGCVDSASQSAKYRRGILPMLVGKLFRGKYHFGKKARRYVAGMLLGSMRGEFLHADWKEYPAHLHINVDQAWRGHKLGQRLMDAYLGQLRSLEVRGVYLETTSLNEVACRLYEKVGFKLLDACPDRFWAKWFGHPVENRCYGMKLIA